MALSCSPRDRGSRTRERMLITWASIHFPHLHKLARKTSTTFNLNQTNKLMCLLFTWVRHQRFSSGDVKQRLPAYSSIQMPHVYFWLLHDEKVLPGVELRPTMHNEVETFDSCSTHCLSICCHQGRRPVFEMD